ncbi:hypothetical protein NL676_008581 [Syzygium grande]|nr:hypothetical protein NL676_008581 [Syzygium grande]
MWKSRLLPVNHGKALWLRVSSGHYAGIATGKPLPSQVESPWSTALVCPVFGHLKPERVTVRSMRASAHATPIFRFRDLLRRLDDILAYLGDSRLVVSLHPNASFTVIVAGREEVFSAGGVGADQAEAGVSQPGPAMVDVGVYPRTG